MFLFYWRFLLQWKVSVDIPFILGASRYRPFPSWIGVLIVSCLLRDLLKLIMVPICSQQLIMNINEIEWKKLCSWVIHSGVSRATMGQALRRIKHRCKQILLAKFFSTYSLTLRFMLLETWICLDIESITRLRDHKSQMRIYSTSVKIPLA